MVIPQMKVIQIIIYFFQIKDLAKLEKLILDGIRDERLETRSFGEDNPDYANNPISRKEKKQKSNFIK